MASTIRQRLRRFNGTDYDTVHLETDDSVLGGYYTRPNLLDNWYFVGGGSQLGGGQLPINQRGQTSYVVSGYNIDRWYLVDQYSGDSLDLVSEGYRVTCGGEAAVHRLMQKIESPISYSGKTITLSILIDSVSDASATAFLSLWVNESEAYYIQISSSGLHTFTYSLPNNVNALTVSFGAYQNKNSVISAIKLEVGDSQTLAHQDSNGNWVLNEIPDFQEELFKCQISTADTTDTYANRTFSTAGHTHTKSDITDLPTSPLILPGSWYIMANYGHSGNITLPTPTGSWSQVAVTITRYDINPSDNTEYTPYMSNGMVCWPCASTSTCAFSISNNQIVATPTYGRTSPSGIRPAITIYLEFTLYN